MNEGDHTDAGEFIPTARPILAPVASALTAPPSHPILLEESRARSVWADIAALIVIVVGFEAAAGLAAWTFLDDSVEDRDILVPMLSLRAIVAVSIVVLILRKRLQGAATIGLSLRRVFVDMAIGVGATPLVVGVVFVVMSMLLLIWSQLRGEMQSNAEQILTIIPRLHPLGFVALALLVGIYEEVVFRGFLMTRLRRATGSWILAVVLSSAIFVALHISQVPAALIAVTILSVSFSVLTIWRRSIVPAIVTHTLWNAGQFLYLFYGQEVL